MSQLRAGYAGCFSYTAMRKFDEVYQVDTCLDPMASQRRAPLHCHPAHPCAVACAIDVHIAIDATSIRLTYRLRADLAQLRLPQLGSVRPGSWLWEHGCFEAFVRLGPGTAYTEFNLAPDGAWAIYPFSAYRQPAPAPCQLPPPRLQARRNGDCYELRAELELGQALDAASVSAMALGLSAVVETVDGQLSWWALRHVRPKPDFHDLDSFVALAGLPAVTGS